MTIKKLAPYCALILLTICTFARSYHNEFLGIDDHVYIWDNPHIRDGLTIEGIKWAFQAGLTDLGGFVDYWQPMVFLSRMVDISLFNFKSGMHHMTNLFFHTLNALLLFALIKRIGKCPFLSFFVSALFAIHPMQAEILGWVTARKDVLSLFFGLITMHAYVWSKDQSVGARHAAPLLAFFFALCLMSKPMMITLPILLLLIDAWQAGTNDMPRTLKGWWPLLLSKWPLFLMVALYLPIPFLGQPRAFEFEMNHPIIRGLTAYSFYAGKLLFPFNLSLYGPVPETVIPAWKVILSTTLLLLASTLSILLSRRNNLILIGWLWFLASSLPIVSLPVADRFMYMPMIGFWLMILSLLSLLFANKKIFAGMLAGALMAFAGLSFKQVAIWKNNETVLKHALNYNSENYAAHNVLGAVYGNRKEFDKAMAHLKEAIRIRPTRDKPYNNIGMILEMQGKPREALGYYEQSLSLNPGDFRTISNIGIIHIREGNTDQGIAYLEKALRLSPKVKGLQNNLAIAYYKEGNIERAEELARQFQSAYALNQFGIFKITESDYESARKYFEEAINLDPAYEEAKNNLNHLNNVLNK